MTAVPFSIPFDAPASLPALAYEAPRSHALLVLGHGAGAPQRHPYITGLATRLAERGVAVVTFDFPYTAQGKRLPDARAVLERAMTATLEAAAKRAKGRTLFAGGKSMGGRIASQVAASGAAPELAGLVFLGYPLHPPKKPAVRRDAHLPDVPAPMLFVQGTRDPFGGSAELAPIVARCAPGSRVFAVEGGDHSHVVPKRSGVDQEAVYAEVADAIAEFVGALSGR